MDITLVNASIFNLPTSHRAAAIVYDGPRDLQLWRPPGPDRDLWDAYGEDLQEVLDKELDRLPNEELPEGQVLRLHPGKLHCDFLMLLSSRDGHGEEQAANAPDADAIEALVVAALEYAGQREVTRVAFPALGGGREALDVAERMAAVVRAVQRYKDECFKAGKPAGIEEVVVCDASSTAVTKAKRLASKVAKTKVVETKPAAAKPAKKKATKRATTGTRRTKGLTAADVAEAHATAAAYDRTVHYLEGQWFMHPKFGAGCVQEVQPDQRIVVMFEDGSTRTMLHAREN